MKSVRERITNDSGRLAPEAIDEHGRVKMPQAEHPPLTGTKDNGVLFGWATPWGATAWGDTPWGAAIWEATI